jgi:hypothetical protein
MLRIALTLGCQRARFVKQEQNCNALTQRGLNGKQGLFALGSEDTDH